EVTGRTAGPVWGTDVYTDDSILAAAAVHAGILQEGQTGVVKVTILPGQQSYQGTTRHGVASMPYLRWDGSFRVEAGRPPEPRAPKEGVAGGRVVGGKAVAGRGLAVSRPLRPPGRGGRPASAGAPTASELPAADPPPTDRRRSAMRTTRLLTLGA